jgi:hypothetical protein
VFFLRAAAFTFCCLFVGEGTHIAAPKPALQNLINTHLNIAEEATTRDIDESTF